MALRVLEFYSGIGGLRFSLEEAGIDATVVEAFEINELANDVYELNFAHRPNQGNIQRLRIQDLDKHRADAWLLSPPCQPYTRQGLQKDSADARASSFLKLLDMLPDMATPPNYILIENVVGFESSLTRNRCTEVLEGLKFKIQEFILSPLQFGMPYSRPRYFCLAKREPFKFRNPAFDGQLVRIPFESSEAQPDHTVSCRPIKVYLDHDPADEPMEGYTVPLATVGRWGDAFDIVTPESTRCCCFTKSYGRYAKGTGSLLATTGRPDNGTSLSELGLRYFTPREIANLHAFPPKFRFPGHISTNQRYALLGNSLNVKVVAYLLQYLFASPEQ